MTPDVAIVGRGLWGTAAAMHLARQGAKVVLIGPGEPADRAQHEGPFASHHDAGRITRRIADTAFWSRISSRSIDRYAGLEAESGIPFYTRSGGLMAGLPGDYADGFLGTATDEGFAHQRYSDTTARQRFPMLRLDPGSLAAFDPDGGTVDPRAMRAAHETLALRAGAEVVDAAALALTGTGVALETGRHVAAGQVIVATGAWAALSSLLPRPAAMTVYARTVVLAEVDEAERDRLATMPSLVVWPAGRDHTLYLLPPVRYLDGKWRLKIGGEGDGPTLTDAAEAVTWFRSPGSAAVGERLLAALLALLPGLALGPTHTEACAVSFTRTGLPYIERLTERVILAAGGCGAGAKCADEVGRLAAVIALGGSLADEGLPAMPTAVLA
ncbi:FAD-dependent oxidoreductase [Rhodobacterales bacterium HKCCE2091]|nr:FAD-dependent oxidoreductase [Rhodobacterales bacterium HKCCE2091]